MTRIFDQLVAPIVRTLGDDIIKNGVAIKEIEQDTDGNTKSCSGNTVPTNGGAGYAKEAFFVHLDAGAGINGLYHNIGTTSACEFVLAESVVPAELTLANGKVYLGNAENVAEQKILAATFAGSALGTHAHASAYTEEQPAFKANQRLYTGAVTGSIVVGATLAQPGSYGTAVVAAVHATYLEINTVAQDFNAPDIVTATNPDLSTATFIPSIGGALDVVQLSQYAAGFMGVYILNAPKVLSPLLLPGTFNSNAAAYRYFAATKEIETFHADNQQTDPAAAGLTVVYIPAATSAVSGGTPAGTVTTTYS